MIMFAFAQVRKLSRLMVAGSPYPGTAWDLGMDNFRVPLYLEKIDARLHRPLARSKRGGGLQFGPAIPAWSQGILSSCMCLRAFAVCLCVCVCVLVVVRFEGPLAETPRAPWIELARCFRAADHASIFTCAFIRSLACSLHVRRALHVGRS